MGAAPRQAGVTDAFLACARPPIGDAWPAVPLLNGLQRFARLEPLFADKLCPDYVPQAY